MDQQTKVNICTGLLAHVGASRREPHFYSFIPGPKTGDFSCPAEVKLLQGLKNTTICCGFIVTETAAYGG